MLSLGLAADPRLESSSQMVSLGLPTTYARGPQRGAAVEIRLPAPSRYTIHLAHASRVPSSARDGASLWFASVPLGSQARPATNTPPGCESLSAERESSFHLIGGFLLGFEIASIANSRGASISRREIPRRSRPARVLERFRGPGFARGIARSPRARGTRTLSPRSGWKRSARELEDGTERRRTIETRCEFVGATGAGTPGVASSAAEARDERLAAC